jgi:SpoVK/Ycf46/Vps4 family AAA+-type ATPase
LKWVHRNLKKLKLHIIILKLTYTLIPSMQGLYLGASLLGSWLLLRWTLKKLDPNESNKKQVSSPTHTTAVFHSLPLFRSSLPTPLSTHSPFPLSPFLKSNQRKERQKSLSKIVGRPVQTDGAFEDLIAQEVVNPASIDTTLSDIGGLDDVIEDLNRNVITPMKQPHLFRTSLLRQKKGVLLYGPPGTGKTMLAKALAKECDAVFINLKPSTMLSKWFGETNKLIAAVWTLACKLQPAIIFIDEVDALLGERRSSEHEAMTAMKTEFMQLWEGFESRTGSNIVVLGATNKKHALDEAVLRRFSLQYEIKVPNERQRMAILKITISRHLGELGEGSVDPALLDTTPPTSVEVIESGSDDKKNNNNRQKKDQQQQQQQQELTALWELARQTEGYSGSDLNELCSLAAARPVYEYIEGPEEKGEEGGPSSSSSSLLLLSPGGTRRSSTPSSGDNTITMRQLSMNDFREAMKYYTPPSRYAQHTIATGNSNGNGVTNGNGGDDIAKRIAEVMLGLKTMGYY